MEYLDRGGCVCFVDGTFRRMVKKYGILLGHRASPNNSQGAQESWRQIPLSQGIGFGVAGLKWLVDRRRGREIPHPSGWVRGGLACRLHVATEAAYGSGWHRGLLVAFPMTVHLGSEMEVCRMAAFEPLRSDPVLSVPRPYLLYRVYLKDESPISRLPSRSISGEHVPLFPFFVQSQSRLPPPPRNTTSLVRGHQCFDSLIRLERVDPVEETHYPGKLSNISRCLVPFILGLFPSL